MLNGLAAGGGPSPRIVGPCGGACARAAAPSDSEATRHPTRRMTRIKAAHPLISCPPKVRSRWTIARRISSSTADILDAHARPSVASVRDMMVRALIHLLQDEGWQVARTRGSHRQFKHPL